MNEASVNNTNHLKEVLKTVKSILKSPNLKKITKNLGVEENILRNDCRKMDKKLTDLSKKIPKNFLTLETTNQIIKIFLYHD